MKRWKCVECPFSMMARKQPKTCPVCGAVDPDILAKSVKSIRVVA